MKENIKELLELAKNSAYDAGKVILQIYEQSDISYERKEDHTPVTAADKEANRIIGDELKRTGIPVLSEEGRNIHISERQQWEDYWLVDPLDGTKEFISRNGEFTVNIALMSGAKPVAGVVYAPYLGLMYFSTGHNEVYKIDKGNIEKLSVKKARSWPDDFMNRETVRVVASKSHMNQQTEAFISQFRKVELLSMGSSLKFMLLAEDKADIYPRIAPTMEWDTAAAHAILMSLNKNIYRMDTVTPLCYNKEMLKNPEFIAF